MPHHLYAETLLAPGLNSVFQWRYQSDGRDLLGIIDPESPVYRALGQAIDRFENTVFELEVNKPTLIEWANSQETLQDAADRRELRLGGAHVFQQSIELMQGMQMMTDREEDPARLSAIHHNIGDVMGFIGQRSGSVHFLEQAAMSYEQALEIRTQDAMPLQWGQTTYNFGLVMQALGLLEDDTAMLKQALDSIKQAVNFLPRKDVPEDWAAAMNSIGILLYQLGTHRRGARMQALGEHEEDIGSLEASIPLYDAVLKVLSSDKLPLVGSMVTANRASAMSALAGESDYLDMAEASVVEFNKLHELFDGTDYASYQTHARERAEQAKGLVASLQV